MTFMMTSSNDGKSDICQFFIQYMYKISCKMGKHFLRYSMLFHAPPTPFLPPNPPEILKKAQLMQEGAGLKGSNYIKRRLQHRCFRVNIIKFLRTAFYIERLRWLLLNPCYHGYFGFNIAVADSLEQQTNKMCQRSLKIKRFVIFCNS